MQRKSALIGIFIGAFLIYLALFGLPTFTLALTSDFTDNFEDGIRDSRWSIPTSAYGVTAPQEVGGILFCAASTDVYSISGYITTSTYDLRNAEVKVEWSATESSTMVLLLSQTPQISDPTAQMFSYRIQYYNSWWYVLRVEQGVVTTIASSAAIPYGTWRIVAENDQTITFHDNLAGQLASDIVPSGRSLGSMYVSIWVATSTAGLGSGDFDNFALSISGPVIPPQTGTLKVETYYDGNELFGVSMTVTHPDGSSQSAVSPYTLNNAPVGTYSASASYQGEWDSGSVYVGAGESKYIQLSWGSQPPPPPNGNWWDTIMDILTNPVVRGGMLAVGVCMIGICSISLIPSTRRQSTPHRRPVAPPHYY